jgi:CheY-like chemotaxis protein
VAQAVRVLVVEDDIELARAVVRRLRQDGMQVVVAPSRATAETLTVCFEVGVFDIDLQDGDGVELAAEMLADGRVEQSVFFSSATFEPSLARAARLGPLVSKRDGVEALVPVVCTLLEPRVPKTSMVVPKAAAVPAARKRTRRAG